MASLSQALAAGGFHSYNNELALLNAFLLKARCVRRGRSQSMQRSNLQASSERLNLKWVLTFHCESVPFSAARASQLQGYGYIELWRQVQEFDPDVIAGLMLLQVSPTAK